MTAAAVIPSAMPDLGMVDTRRWQEVGVTHWHLTRSEIRSDDRDRYEAGRWATIVGARDVEYTFDPDQAFEWLIMARLKVLAEVNDPAAVAVRAGWATEQDWRSRAEMTWWVLTHGATCPAGGGVAIGGNRSVELYATPMTERGCRRHQR